jgi:hypothetical protein
MRHSLTFGFLLAGIALLTTGCSTHSKNAYTAIAQLKTGNTTAALQWSEKLKHSMFSKDLGDLETGRIKMLSGDFSASRTNFAAAIDKILEETETGPAIRVGSVGSTVAASTIADDTVRKYEISPYELIQLLHYQTLNYLFSGDPDGAAVEMRRTVFAQDAIAEKYSKEVADAQEEADQKKAETTAKVMETVQSKIEVMGPTLERTRSAYENGMAWYFCGLVFEKQGDNANASLCYRKAWELTPGSACIRKDFLRLLQTQDRQSFVDLVLQHNMDVKNLTRGSTEIVVIYEESLISQRQAVKIPIPIPDFRGAITLVAADFPVYNDSAYTPVPLAISNSGTELGVTEPAVYLQSLAYRDLKDKIPGVVVRNVTRAITKVAMQQAANNQNDDLVKIGMMAINAASSLATTADTRAWYSIPMVTHLYRGSISSGAHTLECRSSVSGATLKIPVTVSEGETRLIWIADTGGIAVSATASLSGKGLPPTYQQFNNPFWTNGIPGSLSAQGITNPAVESVTSEGSKETAL